MAVAALPEHETFHASVAPENHSGDLPVKVFAVSTPSADTPAATVLVDNRAAVRNEYLQFAEGRAAAICSSIGARQSWPFDREFRLIG